MCIVVTWRCCICSSTPLHSHSHSVSLTQPVASHTGRWIGFSSTTITRQNPSIHPSRQALHCTVEPSLARTVQPSSRGNAGLTSARTEPRTDRSAPRGCYHFRGHHRVTLEVWTAKVSERIVESWKVGVIIIITIKIWQNILRVNDLWGPLCQCTAAEMHTNKTVD